MYIHIFVNLIGLAKKDTTSQYITALCSVQYLMSKSDKKYKTERRIQSSEDFFFCKKKKKNRKNVTK